VRAAGDHPGGVQEVVRDHRAGQPGAVGGEQPRGYLELPIGCPPRA
jgi:hypothetical protein